MIVPAVLAKEREEFIKMLKVCKEFTNFVQIDLMDGKFVPSFSITWKDLQGIKFSLNSEAHLMVDNPLMWVQACKEFGSQRIVFHYEIEEDKRRVITEIRKMGVGVGLAVNPQTLIDEFKYLVDEVDTVLFMSVNPGFYGAKFIPAVYEKIKSFRRLYPNKKIGVDGGVKLNNVREIFEIGVDYIYVGSAILQADNPKQAYLNFLQVLDGKR